MARRLLYVSDMHAHEVIRVDAGGAVDVVATLDGEPSGLGWLPDGRMLIVSMEDRRLLRREPDGTLVEHADLSPLLALPDQRHGRRQPRPRVRRADGLRPAPGRPVRARGVAAGGSRRLDPRGGRGDARSPTAWPIANDDRTLIVAESAGKDLVAFDVADDGSLSKRRVWAELPDHPDGMCIDVEDGVWFVCPVGDRFIRVVEGGAVTDEIAVPDRHAISCALGGADGRTLFMLTAPTHGNPDASRAAMAARIEITDVTVPGAERP